MTAAIYARVSTDEQNVDMQLPDLRRYAERMGWQTVEYLEKASSVKVRPVFSKMLADAQKGKVDVVLVWRIDRFARSMKDFVNITLRLDAMGAGLISVTENVDSRDKSPMGEFMIGLLALMAQLERKIIIARVNAGIAEAKRQGKHCGRPKRIFRRDQALEMRAAGASVRAIAKQFGIGLGTAARLVAAK